MSSSVEGPRRVLRGLGVAAIIAFAAVVGFFVLPVGLQASLREIAIYAALGFLLLLLVLTLGFPNVFDLMGWIPRLPRAQSRRRGNLVDGWPKSERREGDARDPGKGAPRN
jgi:hypothetical protein